jgi:hypothetical protein
MPTRRKPQAYCKTLDKSFHNQGTSSHRATSNEARRTWETWRHSLGHTPALHPAPRPERQPPPPTPVAVMTSACSARHPTELLPHLRRRASWDCERVGSAAALHRPACLLLSPRSQGALRISCVCKVLRRPRPGPRGARQWHGGATESWYASSPHACLPPHHSLMLT